jgi:hypothetical protein
MVLSRKELLEFPSSSAGAALARTTLGLVLCLALAAVSRNGARGVLPAVALLYSKMRTLMLSWGLRAEKQKDRGGQLLCARACPLLRELCVAACFGACGFGLSGSWSSWLPKRFDLAFRETLIQLPLGPARETLKPATDPWPVAHVSLQ